MDFSKEFTYFQGSGAELIQQIIETSLTAGNTVLSLMVVTSNPKSFWSTHTLENIELHASIILSKQLTTSLITKFLGGIVFKNYESYQLQHSPTTNASYQQNNNNRQ